MIKKIFVLAFALLLTISFTTQTKSHANDIDGHPLAEGLNYWANLNVIRPDAKGNYNPNRAVTRGEFASYLTRALDLPPSNSITFTDLKAGQELTNEIQAAAGANILGGYPDGTFRPNDKITREQMAALLQRTLVYKKVPLNGAPLTFKDNASIRDEFKAAVATNVYYNIIAGSLTAKGIYFEPKNSATIAQAAAFLYRMNKTINQYSEEQNGETPTTPPPSNASSYYIGKIANGIVTKNPTIYHNYEQAAAAQKAASFNLIFKGDKIIQMPAGIASAADTTANTVTIYADSSFKKDLTYIAEGNEFKYYSSNDKYAIVRVADTKGYVKMDEVTLTPSSLIKGQNYYYIAGGYLTHKLYNHITQKYIGEYVIGPAPSFMKSGVNYYSQDGVNYYSDFLLTNKVGTYYPYFQFASLRLASNYTAEELDNVIMTILEERQQLGGRYKDATTKSKLIGMGTLLKQVEESHHVNALFILASAIHEGDYGMSDNAQLKNNLFGIKVYDANTALGTTFASRDDSVLAFLNQYVNKNYVPQSGGYANGAAPGNKTSGMNVRYASDPFWGSKIAGHMFRLDIRFSKKDYMSANLAFVINNGDLVNTRIDASTSFKSPFTYKAKYIGETKTFGYPVVIVEEQQGSDGHVWYKILSDDNPPSKYVWVRSDLVKKFTAN